MSRRAGRPAHGIAGWSAEEAQGLWHSSWQRFSCAFATLGLIWMPLVLLRQIDAFIAFLTPLELARDIGLAYLLLLLPAALLSAVAALVQGLGLRLGLARAIAATSAWAVVLLPALWVCVWQLAGSAWAWAKAVSGLPLTVGPHGRVVASLLLLSALALLVRRLGAGGLLGLIVARLRSITKPALALLLPAILVLVVEPPRLLSSAARASGAPAQPPVRKPDIYLITIDTLAEADAQVCGDGPTLMPRLREFAQQGHCFTRAYASGNFTTPSTATLETGALPWTHWAVQIVAKVAEPMQSPSLATRLREAGYETHSISANLLASPRHHGTEREYDTQIIASSTALGSKPREALTLFPNTTLAFWLSALIPFLDTIDVYSHGAQHPYAPEYAYAAVPPLLAKGDKPKFVWVHTLPPHDPYLPPAATKYKLLAKGELERWSEFLGMGSYTPAQQSWIDKHRMRYKESVMGADLALGRFLEQLRREGRLDNALVIISSDHGESFERGFIGHAGELIHNAVLQIPLVVKLPGQTQAGRTRTPVSLIDVVPTLLDYAGAAPLASADGRSLRPALEGTGLSARPVYAMAMERQSRFAPIRQGQYAIIDGAYKLVLHLAEDQAELYDLTSDPLELRDLSTQRPEQASRLKAQLLQQLAAAEARRKRLFTKP